MIPVGGTTAVAQLRPDTGHEVPVTLPRLPAREAAERELSKSMYHEHEPNPLQRALDAFWHWVDNLFNAAAGATPGGALGLLVIALTAALLAVALRLRLGSLQRVPTQEERLFDDRPRTAAQHREAAERHAAALQWDQALQERLRALIRSLEERTLLELRPGRTADEAAAEAGGSLPEHADSLRAAARDFDDVTYGGRHATAETYARLRDLDLTLQRGKPGLGVRASGITP